MKQYSLLSLLVISGFILRVIIAIMLINPHYSRNDDLLRYRDWGKVAYLHGVKATYDAKNTAYGIYANNQPPGTVYTDLAIYATYRVVNGSHEKNELTYDFFIKLPTIIADSVMGILIYLCVRKFTEKRYALLASLLFLFNPVVIYNSTLWGQTDALNNLFFMISLTCLLYKKYFWTILFFFLSLFIKLSLLPLLPLVLLIILKETNFAYKQIVLYIVGSIALLMAITLPISLNPLLWSWQFFTQYSGGELQHITNYAFNFWSIVFNPDYFANVPLSSQVYFGLPLGVWAYSIFGIIYIALLYRVYRSPTVEPVMIVAVAVLTTLAMYLFLPRMHQRYLYPVFPLFAMLIGLTRKYWLIFAILLVINFINLYVTWHPVDFLPLLITNLVAHSKVRLTMSLVITGSFFILFKKLAKMW